MRTRPSRTVVRFLKPGTRFQSADQELELVHVNNSRAYCRVRTKRVVIDTAEKHVEFDRPKYVSISSRTEVDRIL